MSPLGVSNPLRLPADVLAGLRHLPAIARNTEAMAEHTANLDEVLVALQRVAGSTDVLPQLETEMQEVAKTTEALGQMDERMAHIEGAMPVLVEVQQHLANVPEALEQVQVRMRDLSELLGNFLTHVDRLSDSVDRLEVAVGPLGRIAERLPGRSKAD